MPQITDFIPNKSDVAGVNQNLCMHVPVIGKVTALNTSSVLLKAGTSELSGRRKMKVTNLSDHIQVKIGPTSSASYYTAGLDLDPGENIELDFNPEVAVVSIYARSMGGAVDLEVIEQ